MYSTWGAQIALPKSELSLDFSLGAQFSDTGKSPSGSRFTLYKSLFNTFNVGYEHQFNPKWNLSVSDSLMSYPNLDRFSGIRDFESSVGLPAVGQPIAPKGPASYAMSGPHQDRPLAIGGYGGYSGGYPGGYGGFGYGTFMNDFNATLTQQIDKKRQMSYVFDSFRQEFGKLGFSTNTFTATYTQQLNRKLSLIGLYMVGSYGYDQEDAEISGATSQKTGGRSMVYSPSDPLRLEPLPPTPPRYPSFSDPTKQGPTHSIMGGVSYNLSPEITVGFTMGPTITPSNLKTSYGLASSVSLSINKSFRDKSQLSVDYLRFVGGSLSRMFSGRGQLEDLTVTYTRSLSRRMDGTFTALKFTDPFYGSGTLIGGDVAYRVTKKVTGTYSVSYFPGRSQQDLGSIGSGVTNSFMTSYPLGRNLTAFASYFFTVYNTGDSALADELGRPRRSSHTYGNSISVGVMHNLPSLVRIGRIR
ncbi:MAG: hypothetical protein HYR55_02960 [Acidobacteria bacterium]|nr:hypothetical protein [Acidobacteriota bacterium]MBI3654988.1 hypothetical protein [Acidobacteriota bacterium]